MMRIYLHQRFHVRSLVLGVLLFGVTEMSALAAEPPLKLQTLVQEASQQNPEIQSAKQRWEAAKSVPSQVESLPDPIVGLAYRGPDIMREGRVAVQQEFPFPGKLDLRGEVAAKGADRIGERYEGIKLRIIAQLKEAYFSLHFVHKSIEIVSKNIKILEEFEKTAEARYKVGKGIQQDLFRAQVELSRELEELTTLNQEKETLHADINRILNRPPAAQLGAPEEPQLTPLLYTLDELNEYATKNSPVIKAQGRAIEQGQSAVDLANREFYPDFFVGLGAMQSFRSDEQQDAFGMLGIKVPLYYATKQQFGVKESLSSLESARKDHRTATQDVLFRVKDSFVRAERAKRLVKLLGKAIIPQASLALESSIAGYSVGKVDFLTMLDNLLRLQRDEIDLHREKVAHEIAIAKLEEAVAIPLQGGNHE
ncbi:TolC family protein [Candidatus Nitronereus thalassa]|uniref:TolC family protein n=1 Tax=Candidatus Nitronereus thalassa TaxID=3020898 RepID=A0ABU3K2T9_9BACT|nr:TolC family protein [Candidatus Nitronereus thalassa]MDT7040718.1 TolC family protein [Candidatus Nitronereus thalassa]